MNGKREQTVPIHPYSYPVYRGDEISLVDLWRVLAREWKWIAGVTALLAVLAGVYLWLATPVYEVKAVLLPPEPQHIQALNIPGISEISAEKIYREFTRNLRSNALRRQFFDRRGLSSFLGGDGSSPEEVFQEKFNEILQVREVNPEHGLHFLTFQGEDPELIAEWTNDFVQMIATYTVKDQLMAIKRKIANDKETLIYQIRIDQEFAKQRRMDRIAELEEHLLIARELEIFSRNDAPLRAVEGKSLGVAVTTTGEPLYLRGVKELAAEKEILEKRKRDDPFIPGLRDKQMKLAQLDSGLALLDRSTAEMKIYAAHVDQEAVPPEDPVKPKTMLLLILTPLFSCSAGIFLAFFAHFIKKQKKG